MSSAPCVAFHASSVLVPKRWLELHATSLYDVVCLASDLWAHPFRGLKSREIRSRLNTNHPDKNLDLDWVWLPEQVFSSLHSY